jgi:tetratricopeptide (TPR) repeat protein
MVGCASTPTVDPSDEFISSILNYETSLAENHPDSSQQVFKLSDEVRSEIVQRFPKGDKHRKASDLARWLMSPDGHHLIYDLDANLTPAEAFKQRRGNCLSFSLLLVELGAELDIELQVNQVSLPDMWGQDAQDDLIFYRHVNAVYKTVASTQIFDLAMEEYKPGFPQKLISKHQAKALLFSNIGIEKLKKGNIDGAIHYLTLSASTFPSNPDMWINLGAAYKHIDRWGLAEKIFLHAISIGDKNSLAASNLERLYRSQGRANLANLYQKLAARVRARNPYVHYLAAEKAYQNKEYRRATKSIKRAIKLYKEDPDFYELSSRLKQIDNKHISAIQDLEKAHQLSQTPEARGRYVDKVKMVIARVKKLQEERGQQGRERPGIRHIELNGPSY